MTTLEQLLKFLEKPGGSREYSAKIQNILVGLEIFQKSLEDSSEAWNIQEASGKSVVTPLLEWSISSKIGIYSPKYQLIFP